MRFLQWIEQNQYRWVGFRALEEQIVAALGGDFEVEASVVDIRHDRQGNSKERRYLFLTPGGVVDLVATMHPGADLSQQEMTATVRWLPLSQVAGLTYAVSLGAHNLDRPDARYTLKFNQESGLGPLVLPTMEKEDLQPDEIAEYLAFGQALSRRLVTPPHHQ